MTRQRQWREILTAARGWGGNLGRPEILSSRRVRANGPATSPASCAYPARGPDGLHRDGWMGGWCNAVRSINAPFFAKFRKSRGVQHFHPVRFHRDDSRARLAQALLSTTLPLTLPAVGAATAAACTVGAGAVCALGPAGVAGPLLATWAVTDRPAELGGAC